MDIGPLNQLGVVMAGALVTTELPSSHRDLLEAAGVGSIATIGPDGQPHVSAVWYLLDDDGLLKITMKTNRQKIRNLRRRPTATFFMTDPHNQYRTLEVRAIAAIEPDDDGSFAGRVGAKYGADVRANDQQHERRVVVTLHPIQVNPRDGRTPPRPLRTA